MRGEERLRGPRASSAHYDAGRDRVIVRLTTGMEIGFAPRDAEGLQHATREDLAEIEVQAFGLGIHFTQRLVHKSGRPCENSDAEDRRAR